MIDGYSTALVSFSRAICLPEEDPDFTASVVNTCPISESCFSSDASWSSETDSDEDVRTILLLMVVLCLVGSLVIILVSQLTTGSNDQSRRSFQERARSSYAGPAGGRVLDFTNPHCAYHSNGAQAGQRSSVFFHGRRSVRYRQEPQYMPECNRTALKALRRQCETRAWNARNNRRRVAYPSAATTAPFSATFRKRTNLRLQHRVLERHGQDNMCLMCLQLPVEISCMHNLCYRCCVSCASEYLGRSGELSCEDCRNECVDRVDLSCHSLEQMPSKVFIYGHSCLTVLNLASNRLTSLPDSFELLCNLEELYLQNNCLQKLPASLCNIKTLMDVDLRNNELYTVPDNIGSLFSLKYLDLSENNLGWLPPSLTRLASLSLLDLNSNFLSRLPASFGNLRALRVLSVSNNRLRTLPCSLGGCRNLEKIDCRNNLLEMLPVEMFACHSLTCINLDNNRLLRLPWQIMNISSSLRNLSLKNNKLSCVPSSLLRLRLLSTFCVQQNPLMSVSDEQVINSSYRGESESVVGNGSSQRPQILSLAELSAQSVVLSGVSYSTLDVSLDLYNRLAAADTCHAACGRLTVLQYSSRYDSCYQVDVGNPEDTFLIPLVTRLCPQCEKRQTNNSVPDTNSLFRN